MDRPRPDTEPVVSVFEPVLGTRLEVRTMVEPRGAVDAVEQRVLAEIDRLETVFSIYDETSELRRWREGHLGAPSDELTTVLGAAARWFDRSAGAFNPTIGVLTARWRAGSTAGAAPSPAALADAVASIATLPYAVAGGWVHRRGDCGGVDLNAGAKGYIVDRALAAGLAEAGVVGLTVNLGGDLAHHGADSLLVGIEDPNQPHDNAPPLVVVEVGQCGLATSGSARRGFRIGESWWGHVLDPRTGMPVDNASSVSVLAPDAMTADFVATIVAVLGPGDGLAFADALDAEIGVCLIDARGTLFRNECWRGVERAS